MKLEDVVSVLQREADNCQRYADNWKTQKTQDEDVMMYWIGKRRGMLDALKYLGRMTEGEE